MMSTKPDISICLTFHSEKWYARRTLQCIEAQLTSLSPARLQVEILLNLDNADELTSQIVNDWQPNVTHVVYVNSFGDAAQSRNFLIKHAQGTYITFCDGDDLFSPNWLIEAYRLAKAQDTPTVIAPGYNLLFDRRGVYHIIKMNSTTEPFVCQTNAIERNPIQSANFVHRSIYEHIPYHTNDELTGFEDWRWSLDICAAGYNVIVAPNTLFFYRQKSFGAINVDQTIGHYTIGKSKYFEPKVFRTLTHLYVDEALARLPADHAAGDVPIYNQPYEIVTSESVEKPTPAGIRGHGRRIAANLLGSGRLYYFTKHQYRAIQSFVAPLVHKLRHSITLSQQKQALRALIVGERDTPSPSPEPADAPPVIKLMHGDTFPYDQLAATAMIEPQLDKPIPLNEYGYPDQINMSRPSAIKDAYYDMCVQTNGDVDDLLMAGELDVSSTETQSLISLISDLTDTGRRVMVICESTDKLSRAEMTRLGASVWPVDRMKAPEQTTLLRVFSAIIENWGIKTLTVTPNLLARDFVHDYGRHIRRYMKLLVYIPKSDAIQDSLWQLADTAEKSDTILYTTSAQRIAIAQLFGTYLTNEHYSRKSLSHYKS